MSTDAFSMLCEVSPLNLIKKEWRISPCVSPSPLSPKTTPFPFKSVSPLPLVSSLSSVTLIYRLDHESQQDPLFLKNTIIIITTKALLVHLLSYSTIATKAARQKYLIFYDTDADCLRCDIANTVDQHYSLQHQPTAMFFGSQRS